MRLVIMNAAALVVQVVCLEIYEFIFLPTI